MHKRPVESNADQRNLATNLRTLQGRSRDFTGISRSNSFYFIITIFAIADA
jgi:hypothetical protein